MDGNKSLKASWLVDAADRARVVLPDGGDRVDARAGEADRAAHQSHAGELLAHLLRRVIVGATEHAHYEDERGIDMVIDSATDVFRMTLRRDPTQHERDIVLPQSPDPGKEGQ